MIDKYARLIWDDGYEQGYRHGHESVLTYEEAFSEGPSLSDYQGIRGDTILRAPEEIVSDSYITGDHVGFERGYAAAVDDFMLGLWHDEAPHNIMTANRWWRGEDGGNKRNNPEQESARIFWAKRDISPTDAFVAKLRAQLEADLVVPAIDTDEILDLHDLSLLQWTQEYRQALKGWVL